MATQGLITIMKDGQVAAKIIAGCNGYNAKELAKSLRERPTLDIGNLLVRAEQHDMGCADCLYVMTSPDDFLCIENVSELPPLYREKFSVPGFNPRWEHGTAAFNEIVEYPSEAQHIGVYE